MRFFITHSTPFTFEVSLNHVTTFSRFNTKMRNLSFRSLLL